ncbi:MAG TPA: alkaline phosphatase family protein [Candidatus Nanoarchaeia archaeon]|nr:alkaline phosphatase family protein [Candidatus Nanoarchaeia archaeon]
MKGILVILDGLGDLPLKQLGDKTPLEAAEMPNLDFLANRGQMGDMHPVRPGFVPESDEAVVSIFGNELVNSSRGQLEARGAGLKMMRGDLALRVNFATIDSLKSGQIIDRRAGRTLTTAEAEILSKALNKIKLPCVFEFRSTVQHRAVLVLRGGFSDNITGNDYTYSKGETTAAEKIGTFKPLDEDENSTYTANILKEFVDKAYEVLDRHPVNNERRKKGLMPANYLLMRGAGIEIPKLKFYKRWMAVTYMPLEKGFVKISGMTNFSFDYPKLKNLDAYSNLWEGLKKACSFSEESIKKNHKDFDYAYIHIKETDLPGHDNKPSEKKRMLEYIDQTFFKFLAAFAPPNKIKVVVTGDHSTPCRLKAHSADPVPILFYNQSIPRFGFLRRIRIPSFFKKKTVENPETPEKKGAKFCEREARKGALGSILGKDLLEKLGFNR